MLAVIRLGLNYYKIAGHVILGFKNINIDQWLNVMSKPDTAADELAIFVLNKMYSKHTVIYNKARPWTTLDSYGILRHKPFVETTAPLSVESMLEPMKLCKTPKKQCQNEPWDLSIRHSDQSVDVSAEGLSLDNTNMSKEQYQCMMRSS